MFKIAWQDLIKSLVLRSDEKAWSKLWYEWNANFATLVLPTDQRRIVVRNATSYIANGKY